MSEQSEEIQIFLTEAVEMLQEMENCLLKLEEETADESVLDSLFRSIHTMKGSSGIFGLDQFVEYTHNIENVLDSI